MVSSAAIGRRIRELRKQKHISQEKMAEDLFMYQADISNIERDADGSDVNDIFKLDKIAQYLGVSLLDLLGVSEAEPVNSSFNSLSTLIYSGSKSALYMSLPSADRILYLLLKLPVSVSKPLNILHLVHTQPGNTW